MTDGVHAELRVRNDREYPLWTVLTRFEVRSLRPAAAEAPPQVVLEGDEATVVGSPRLQPVVETASSVVCRLQADGGGDPAGACGHDRCLGTGLDFLPVAPYHVAPGIGELGFDVVGPQQEVRDAGSTGNDLYGASVTDDGERLWFTGASGAIGEYDVVTGDRTDHPEPTHIPP